MSRYEYMTHFKLPRKLGYEYGYGLLNNVIDLNIPVKGTDLKLKLSITLNDIMKMDIKEMIIDQDSFETEVKKFLIKELQKELE